MSSYGNRLADFSPQMESSESFEYEGFEQGESGEVFNESEQMELAAELLEITNEQELEQFLGDLIKKAGSAIGSVVKSPIGKAIGGVLKTAAGAALPLAGTALGGFVGGPLGAQIGGGLASMAGSALGLELEGLSSEDREFEATKQFVKFAGETVKNALQAAPNADPVAAAKAAAVEAARVHAPGLLSANGAGGAQPGQHGAKHGRWVRRGNHIIVHGV
jgi:hypothetical protein